MTFTREEYKGFMRETIVECSDLMGWIAVVRFEKTEVDSSGMYRTGKEINEPAKVITLTIPEDILDESETTMRTYLEGLISRLKQQLLRE